MFDYKFLRNIEINNLRRNDLGSSLDFNEVVAYIERIRSNLLFFEGREGALLETDKEQLVNIYKEFVTEVNAVQRFSQEPNENQTQAQSRRMSIIKKFRALQKQSNVEILPIITALKFDDTKIQETILNVQNKLTQIDNQFSAKL
ncbi:MAG: hypothetical protein UX81_C0032G0001, partial [Parcubacteria group bacterium GW2011_GWA2_47_12]